MSMSTSTSDSPAAAPSLPLELDGAALAALVDACARFVRRHIDTLPSQRASPVGDAQLAEEVARLVERVREPLPARGRPVEDALDLVGRAVAPSFNTAGPGYLAFIPGGGLPTAGLGEWIALATNRFVGMRGTAPVVTAIEAQAVAWLAELVGFPSAKPAAGLLTSGGSLSNFIAIVTARVDRLGEEIAGGTIYCSTETHLSVMKAAKLAGLPERAVRRVPIDARRRLDASALARLVAEDRASGLRPFLVVANGGSTNTGAVDPLDAILAIARREKLWLHVDAAYGGFFRAATGGRDLLPLVEEADSLTLDPHKGLFLPYGTGCLLVRDGRTLERAHSTDAAYLHDADAGLDLPSYNDLSPELSREWRGLRVWLPLALHGADAFRAALDEKRALARRAWERLQADARFAIVDEPQLSVVAFRLADRDDAANAELLRRVNARGRVFLSSTRLDGRLVLRLCVLSFRTHADRVDEAVDALLDEAGRV